MSEWEKFKVGKPANKGFTSSCKPFDSVSHTSHISSAIDIIEAGEVRPSLVFDESILNDQRILVSWLSPNYWSTGFRYGNIKFDFSFNELIEGKKFYWVEAVAYKIQACRILITDINRKSQLEPYDPASKAGPWWFDTANNIHYFNNNYCLEFMFEAPVELDLLKKLDFVEHHSSYCSINRYSPNRCRELGLNSSRGGALFLTRAAVAKVNLSGFSKHFIRDNGKPNNILEFAFLEFVSQVSLNTKFSGTLTEDSESSIAVMRAIMSAFTFSSKKEAKFLSALFKNLPAFTNTAAILMAKVVGLEKWEELTNS